MKSKLAVVACALMLAGVFAESGEAWGPRGGARGGAGGRGFSGGAPQGGAYRGGPNFHAPANNGRAFPSLPQNGGMRGPAHDLASPSSHPNSARTLDTHAAPLGGTYGHEGQAGTITGPNGGTATGAKHGGVYNGPGGTTVIHGAGRGAVTGPGGNSAAGRARGTVVVTPNGNVHVAGSHGGIANVNGTYHVHDAHLHATAVAVNQAYPYAKTFTGAWYARHPGAWYAAGWASATAYTAATWDDASTYCAVSEEPVTYDYGSTTVYQDENVYQNGEPIATQEEFYQQAQQIADAGRDTDSPTADEWRPLGVYALLQGEETSASNLFQLAINREGVLRGNYFNALTETTLPVLGAVDAKSQRVAWTIGDRKDLVYEAGLSNLTQPATPILVHFGSERTQQMTLVRIEPKQE